MAEDYTIPSDIPAEEQTVSAPAAYSRPLTTTLTTPAEEQQVEPNDNLERYNQIVSFLGKGAKLSAKKTAEELTQSDLDAANTAYLEKINSHMESIGAEPFPDLGSVDFDAIAKKEEEYNVKNANENLKKVKSKYPSLSNIPEFTSLEDIKKRSSEINTKKQSLESQEAVSAWNKQAKEMNEKFGVSVPTIKSASELSSAKKKLKNIVDTYDKAAPVKLMEFPVSPMATQPGGVRGDIPAQNLATQPSVQNLQKKKEELKKESEGMYRQYKADMAFMPKMVELGVSPQSIELITGKTTGHPIQSYTDPKIVETKEEAYSKAAINHINGDISNIDKQIKETSSALQAATPDQYEELSSKWKSLVKARDILVDKQAYLNQEVRRIRIGTGETGTIGNEMVGTIEALTYAFINTGARILSGIPSFSLQLVSSALDSPLANKAVSESLGELSKNVAEFGDIFKKPMEYAFGRTEESLTENYPVSSFLGSMGLYLVPELSAGQSAAMMFSDNFSSNYQKYKNLPPENAFIINSLQSAASAYLMSKGLEVTKGHGAINGIVYEALNMMPKPIRLSQLNPAIDKILSSAKTGVSSSISSGLSFAALNPATVATESLISNVNNWISENKVDAHDFAQTTLDMLHSSARGIKDGIIIGGIMAPVNAWRTNSMNKEMFATASMLRDHATMTVSINKIKQAVANGTITKEQGTENIKGLMNLLNKINQIPKNISINHQFEAFKLLNENERLQQESSGLNESFKKPFLDNIERNNKRLEKIGMMSDQISYHESEGGSTFVRGRNQLGEKVSSVSIFPERTVKIEGPVTQEDIDNFKEANKDLLEGNEDILSVGTWKDENGKTYIDISAITPHAEAEALGRMYNQKAVFNLEKNKEVPTGGTGEPMEGMKSEADRVKDIRELVGRTKATEADFKPIGVEEVASKLGEKHPMVRAVNNAMSALTKLPGFLDNNTINVRFHDSHASMQHAMNIGAAKQFDAKSTKGSFSYKKNSKGGYDITIDFNLKKGAGDATIRHEFTHAMLLHLIGDRSLDVMKKFQDAFRSFGSKYNDKAVMEFAERYSKKTIRPEEYFAELSAIRRNIKPSVLSKIAEFINGLAKSVFGDKFVPFKNVNDANDVIRYFGSLAKAVRTGEAVDLKPFDKIEGSHNMIAYDTKINIEDGVDKITITKDANGNEVERRSEFTEDDIESELNRLEELAKEKKLTFNDFEESYFGQAAEDDARAEAKIDIKNDQLKFVQDLRKALEGESVEVKEKDTEEDVTKEGEEPLIDKIKSKQSLGGKFTSELMAQEIIDKLKEDGYLKEEESILSLRGKTVIAMWPDNKMVGDLFFGEGDKKRKVLEGNGGIYFSLKFNKDGTFWASTHKGSNALMDTINKLFDENGGESVYVVVFKGTDTKVLSSRDGMAAAMDIISAIAENGDIPLSLFKSALSKATEKELLPDGKKRFPANQSSAEMHKQIKDFFLGADDKSFKRRSEIAKKIISTVFKDKSLNHEKIASDLGMKLGKSGKIMVSDVFERLGNVQEEGFLENVKKGFPYAIVEIPSKLTIEEDKKHVSYPATMKTVDGKRVIVSTLRDNSMNLADIQTKSGVPLSELDRKQAQGAIGNAQRGFNVIKIEPSVKSKQQLVTDKKMIKKMTEDEDGNYLFYHYSPSKIAGKIDPRFFGRNPKTGRDERPGIGISMYYTRPDYRDVGGNYGYVVRVPKDKVYPFNEDPLNLYDKAEATFQKMYPGQAFDPNKQVAFIAQEAAKLGYDMTVAKWGDQLRAQTTKPMKGEWYEKPHPEYRYSPVYNPKLEGFQANEKKSKVKSKQRLSFGDEVDIEGVDVKIPQEKEQDILKADRSTKKYFDDKVKEMKPSGLSKDELKKLLDSDSMAILTGTNPDGNAVDDKTNDSLNKKAEEWLKENNYKYHEVTGKYGQTESSFIVEGMTSAEAMDFAERFKQDSVAHSEGLVYRRGAINRRDNSGDEFGVDVTGPEEDFVSAIKTKDGEVVGFKIGYDFDKEEQYNPEPKSKQRLDEEEIRGKMDKMFDAYSKQMGKRPVEEIVNRVIRDIQHQWIPEGSQIEFENAVRQFKKDNGIKVKSAPSHETIFGEKPSKMEVDNKGSLKAQIKLEMMAAMGGRVATEDFMKSVAKGVNSMAVDGVITPEQATRIIKRMANLDQNNPEALDKFYKWVDEMFEGAKQNQEKIEGRAEIKGQMSVKNFMRSVADRVKSMVGRGVITANQASAITRRMAFLNPKNAESVDKFYKWVDKIFSNADYADRLKEANTNRKKIKKNGASKNVPEMLQSISRMFSEISPDEVSDIDKYNEMAAKLNEAIKPGTVTIKKDGTISDNMKVATKISEIEDYIESQMDAIEKEREKSEPKDDTEAVSYLKDKIESMRPSVEEMIRTGKSPIDGDDVQLSSKDKSMLNELMDIKTDDKQKLKRISEAIDHLMVNGDMGNIPHIVIQNRVDVKSEKGIEILKKATSGGVKRLKIEGLVSRIRGMLWKPIMKKGRKGYALDWEYLLNNSVRQIDLLLKQLDGMPVFNSTFKELASGYANYKSKLGGMDASKIWKKMLSSYSGDIKRAVQSNYKITMYLRQLEHESNPGRKKILPAIDYYDAIIESRNNGLNTTSKKEFESVMSEFIKTDEEGNRHIDKDAIYESMNKSEREAVASLQDLYKELLPYAQEVSKIRGTPFEPIGNYSHINANDVELPSADVMASEMDAFMNGNVSTRAGQLESRTGKAVSISLDPFATANKAIRDVMLDYYMTNPIKVMKKITEGFRESTTEGTDEDLFAQALRDISNELIKKVVVRSYSEDSIIDKAIEIAQKRFIEYQLANPTKAAGEIVSNMAYISTRLTEEFAVGAANYSKYILGEDGSKILENINSYSTDRLYPHGFSGKFIDPSAHDLSVSDTQNIPSELDRARSIAYYNTLLKLQKVSKGVSAAMLTSPDVSLAIPTWFGSMAVEFKRITGKEIDFDKIKANDFDYINENRDAIDKSRDLADKNIADAFSTRNPFLASPRLSNVENRSRVLHMMNNMLSNFSRGEFDVVREAAVQAVHNGHMSKADAARTIAAATVRAGTYKAIKNMSEAALLAIGGYLYAVTHDDEEDDELTKKLRLAKNEQEAAKMEIDYFVNKNPKLPGVDPSVIVNNYMTTSDRYAVEKMKRQAIAPNTFAQDFAKGAIQSGVQFLLNRNFGSVQNNMITAPLFEEFVNKKLHGTDYDRYRDAILYDELPSGGNKYEVLGKVIEKSAGPIGVPTAWMIGRIAAAKKKSEELQQINKDIADIESGTPTEKWTYKEYEDLLNGRRDLTSTVASQETYRDIMMAALTATSTVPFMKNIKKVVDRALTDNIIKTTDWDKLLENYETLKKAPAKFSIYKTDEEPKVSEKYLMEGSGFKKTKSGWIKRK